MRKRYAKLLLAVPLLFAFAPAPKVKDPKADEKAELKKLQGTWQVVSMERGGVRGRVVPYDHAVIKDTSWTYLRADREYAPMTLVLDPKAKPKTVDFLRASSPAKGAAFGGGSSVRYRGIYQLDGDTLKVCYVLSSGERPKEFTAAGREYLLTLKRVKP